MIPLKGLAHTADYFTYDDEEKRNKFFKLIHGEMKQRKQLMAQKAAQNFHVYNQIAEEPLKALAIVVDGTDEFVERINENYEDEIADVLERVAGLGVMLVFSIHSSKFHGYDELTGFIKKSNYGLVLGDQGMAEIFPMSYSDTVEFGRGFLFSNGSKVEVMLPEC